MLTLRTLSIIATGSITAVAGMMVISPFSSYSSSSSLVEDFYQSPLPQQINTQSGEIIAHSPQPITDVLPQKATLATPIHNKKIEVINVAANDDDKNNQQQNIKTIIANLDRSGSMGHISDDVLIEMLQQSPDLIEQLLMSDDDKRIIDNYFEFDYDKFWAFGPLSLNENDKIHPQFNADYPIIDISMQTQIPDNELDFIDQASALGGINLNEYEVNIQQYLKKNPNAVIHNRYFHEPNYFSHQRFLFKNNPFSDYEINLPMADNVLSKCLQEQLQYQPKTHLLTELQCFNQVDNLIGLEKITSLNSLDLKLTYYSNISTINNLSNIEDLTLDGIHMVDIKNLKNLNKLRHLSLANTNILNSHMLNDFANLTTLSLREIKQFDSQQLARLQQLQALSIASYNDINDQILQNIEPLENLEMLHLAYGSINNSQQLEKLKNLKYLHLEYVDINNIDFIQALEHLEFLIINGGQFTQLPDLSNNPKLKWLQLVDGKLTTVANLSRLNAPLNYLNLSDNQLTQLPKLQHLSDLQALNVSGNRLKQLPALTELDNLKLLYVFNNALTDIKALLPLSQLMLLHIQGNFIADISHLQRLNQLYDIILAGNPITDCYPADLLQNLMGQHWCEPVEVTEQQISAY